MSSEISFIAQFRLVICYTFDSLLKWQTQQKSGGSEGRNMCQRAGTYSRFLSKIIANFGKIEMIDKSRRLISWSESNGHLIRTRKSYHVAARVRRGRRIQYEIFQVKLVDEYGSGFPWIKVGDGTYVSLSHFHTRKDWAGNWPDTHTQHFCPGRHRACNSIHMLVGK